MRHELKTDPRPFAAVWDGTKLYEIRKDDRTGLGLDGHTVTATPYGVGDELLLRETRFSGEQMRGGRNLEYTGREVLSVVTHKLTASGDGSSFGIARGWCILGIKRMELIDRRGPHNGSHRMAEQPKEFPNVQPSTGGPKPLERSEWEHCPIIRVEKIDDGARNVHLMPNGMEVFGDSVDADSTLHREIGKVVGEGVKTRDPVMKQAEVGLGAVMPRVPGWSVAQPPEHWVVRFGIAEAVARMHSTSPLFCMGANCFSDGTTPHSPECIAEHEATVNLRGMYDHVHTAGTNGRTETTATGPGGPNPAQPAKRAFSHYFRPTPYHGVDVYRILSIFEVVHPAIQHAIKKLLVAGKRGAKDTRKDWSEAVVSINRAIEMMDEDDNSRT